MTKLSAGVLKKVPVPGIEFSNHQFSSGLEVEVPDGATDEALAQRLRELFALLSRTVEAEIAAASEAARAGDFKARFPDPDAVAQSRDDRPASNGRRDEFVAAGHRQGFRQGSREDDRGGRRGFDDGRGYQGPSRPEDRYDGGARQGGSWRERGQGNGGAGRSSQGSQASQAQIKAVFGIAKGRGIERRDLMERVEERFGVRRIEDLNVRQASSLIESLKAS